MSWFQVDKEGLRRLIEDRGKTVIFYELIQNAWDTDATDVRVFIDPVPGKSQCRIQVTDNDPTGFKDISHAYTLFAESEKKGDATKRGRFNFGEKLALAHCFEASLITTTGSILFDSNGKMRKGRKKTERGTTFKATIRMTRDEMTEVLDNLRKLIPPESVMTSINGTGLDQREPVAEFEASLPTVVADEEGVLRRRSRKATIKVFRPLRNEEPTLYEMGIPVCSWDHFHVSVEQKVPLSLERDNVSESYRRRLRAEILNHCSNLLSEDDSSSTWVTNALEDPRISDGAVREIVEKRFGEEAVSYDPSDVEASQRAAAKGWTVVHGRNLPKKAWEAVRRAGALTPAGRKIPTPKPFSTDPDADEAEIMPPEEWTEGMIDFATSARMLACALGISDNLEVHFVTSKSKFGAAWGDEMLYLFIHSLGGIKRFKLQALVHDVDLLDLLIHEFAHHFCDSHLDDAFHKACSKIGAKIAILYREGVV